MTRVMGVLTAPARGVQPAMGTDLGTLPRLPSRRSPRFIDQKADRDPFYDVRRGSPSSGQR